MENRLETFLNGYLGKLYKICFVTVIEDEEPYRRHERNLYFYRPNQNLFFRFIGINWIKIGSVEYSSSEGLETITVGLQKPYLDHFDEVKDLFDRAIKMAKLLGYLSQNAELVIKLDPMPVR